MGKKKKSNREKRQNRPPRLRFITRANQFHQEVVAPLERAYRHAMRIKNYDMAGESFKKMEQARREHRILLFRHEKMPIR